MSISISSSSISASNYVSAVSSSKVSSAVDSVTGDDSSDSSSVSGPAAILSKLKALQASDPAKFKEAMSAISKKLTKDADASTDAKQKQVLTDMASKFSTAGQTGDLSGITPPSGASGAKGGHHGGGHGGPPPSGGGVKGASSSSSSSSSSSTTSAGAADTNGDGKVSEAKLAAYTVKQEDSGAGASRFFFVVGVEERGAGLREAPGQGPAGGNEDGDVGHLEHHRPVRGVESELPSP